MRRASGVALGRQGEDAERFLRKRQLSRFPAFPWPTPSACGDGCRMPTALALRDVHVEPVMGTVVSLDIRGVSEPVAQAASARLMAWLHDVDRRFSTYRDDSEISRIDRN